MQKVKPINGWTKAKIIARLKRKRTCPVCDGEGEVSKHDDPRNQSATCPKCEGRGVL